mmetsp:Transcript_44963/g.83922  ORF Transcript_44963/g.83922 Transcript_44963/m.83922 type:complete len:106 (-) Transcript_44963:511-828(-)
MSSNRDDLVLTTTGKEVLTHSMEGGGQPCSMSTGNAVQPRVWNTSLIGFCIHGNAHPPGIEDKQSYSQRRTAKTGCSCPHSGFDSAILCRWQVEADLLGSTSSCS